MADVIGDAIIKVVIDTSQGDDPANPQGRRRRKTDESGEGSSGEKAPGEGTSRRPTHDSPLVEVEETHNAVESVKRKPEYVREFVQSLSKRFGVFGSRVSSVFPASPSRPPPPKVPTSLRRKTLAEAKRIGWDAHLETLAEDPGMARHLMDADVVGDVRAEFEERWQKPPPPKSPSFAPSATATASLIGAVVALSEIAYSAQPTVEGAVGGLLGTDNGVLANNQGLAGVVATTAHAIPFGAALQNALVLGRGIQRTKQATSAIGAGTDVIGAVGALAGRGDRALFVDQDEVVNMATAATEVEYQRRRLDEHFTRSIAKKSAFGATSAVVEKFTENIGRMGL